MFNIDTAYRQPDDVERMIHVHVPAKGLIQLSVVLRFLLGALGLCIIMVVNMLEVKTYENLDFPYERR